MAARSGESDERFTVGERPVSESTCGDNLGSQNSCSSLDLAIEFLRSVCVEVDVPYGGWYRTAGAAVGLSRSMGILVGGDCRVAETFRGKRLECKACSGCGNRVVVTAQRADVGALVCKCLVVCGTGVSMNMEVGRPTRGWYEIAGMTRDQCQGGGSLFSQCRKVVAIPGEHLEAAVVAS